jgi:hypothetical protein
MSARKKLPTGVPGLDILTRVARMAYTFKSSVAEVIDER